ncbi:MAG TPA: hypothetical protein VEE84_09265 [Burkholderiaceae bacterium]|nr:hypothetical protein [Burkholderiaceae bacterium]
MSEFFDQHRKRLEQLTHELEELERKAGFSDSVATNVEFIDKKDLRLRYFGVSDPQMRRALIAKYRELMQEHRQRYLASIADTKARIAEARKRAGRAPWAIPASIAACAVLLAYLFWSLAGALAGAAAVLFLGKWYVTKRRLHFAEELRLAQDELQTEEQGWREQLQGSADALAFSKTEEQNGREDPQ